MTKKAALFLTLIITLLVFYLYTVPLGQLSPVGSFFHPVKGFWANAETVKRTGAIRIQSEKLNEPVDVFVDERGVPHIFAQNDYDLYFAQGYVTARDRLFQMEVQIRAAGGKLSEWLGSDLIEYDRHQRRLGMMYGAERAMEAIEEDEAVREILQAYADGVNAYVETLHYETWPLEYKILDVEPSAWKPFNTALLLKYMTQMLAGHNHDVRTSNTLAHFGEEFVNRFISSRSDLMDPIMPPGTPWDFDAISVEAPDELFLPSFTQEIELWQPNPLNGSNNWVVDGLKTAGGYPILSNDMHLNMSMPAIWYEVQLHTPEHNVYGVSLQGTPTVIVGFNEHIAWGSTNTGAEVMDWYEITFRDDDRREYLHDGEWLPVSGRVEIIHVRGSEAVTDTILFTHHGPVYETEERTSLGDIIHRDHALRWIAHDPSNDLKTFYLLNRAEGYEDFREAFRYYQAPAQNMNYAGTDGNIAMQTGGRLPVKWEYQGRSVGDGSDSRFNWTEFIPYEQNPFSLNPERGFLSAANQYPADVDYPYYLGDFFAPYERGRRINDLLQNMENITVDDFKTMLKDNFSYHAYKLLPVLLERTDTSALNDTESGLFELLRDWEFMNESHLIEPSVFRRWWVELNNAIWDNKYDTEYPMRRPQRDKTVDLILNEPESNWFNNVQTEETETLDDLALQSFQKAVSNLVERYGEPGEAWQWGYVNNTNLNHVAQIPGLGVTDVFTGGGPESINAIFSSHGPSWRMLVELDPDGVRGYGVYPGGQSGNPGSKTYDEFVETWQTGELFELMFLRQKPADTDDFPLLIRFEN